MSPRHGAAAAAVLLALLAGQAAAQPHGGYPGGWGGSVPAAPPRGMDPYSRPPSGQPGQGGGGSGLFLAVPPELLMPQPEMVGPPPPAPSQPMFTDGWTRDGFGASR